jgi:hypothetical protein
MRGKKRERSRWPPVFHPLCSLFELCQQQQEQCGIPYYESEGRTLELFRARHCSILCEVVSCGSQLAPKPLIAADGTCCPSRRFSARISWRLATSGRCPVR